MGLFDVEFWKNIEPNKEKKFAHGLFDGLFTLFFKPNEVTHEGSHIKGIYPSECAIENLRYMYASLKRGA